MTFSEYLSKRISWNAPLRLPRLSLTSILHPQSLKGSAIRPPMTDDASTDITAITYPTSPTTSRGASLRAYIRRTCEPFIHRFRPRGQVFVPESAKVKMNTIDIPVLHSIFQLPPSPSSLSISPTSPTLPAPVPEVVSQLQMDRTIRAEQNTAYERAEELDRDLCKKILENRIHEEQLKRRAEQKEQKRILEQEEAAYRRAQNDWRRWARRTLIPAPRGGDAAQFAVRLPCGQRYICNLASDASLEVAHVYVETLLIPSTFSPEDDPEDPPAGYEHHWGFRLVITNPRFVVPNDSNSKLLELEGIKKGLLLVVEATEDTRLAELRKVD
ncbi:hypothetical protein B0J17DRAFT_717986 [Rhizoctonia solani]|nr:hypothetical protein B0J17DRAFT_717986 [Rhizoctonia solani]